MARRKRVAQRVRRKARGGQTTVEVNLAEGTITIQRESQFPRVIEPKGLTPGF